MDERPPRKPDAILATLNLQQREAVEATEGPLLVVAGAGSGKTRVITTRIAYLIGNAGVRPEEILAVTFTNKAAAEMKSRVGDMLDPSRRTGSPLISTFHSLCVRILRRDAHRLEGGYTRNFTIYDGDDQARLVRRIIKDLGFDERIVSVRQALSAISWAKNRRISPAAYARQTTDPGDRKRMIAAIYKVFNQRLQQANALDFDDLLIKAVHLLQRVPETREYYHRRFPHVMIDEFQDTNGIQYELARLIVTGREDAQEAQGREGSWKNRSLCVVGDVDQSIYAFRGSDFNIILGFQHDFAGTRVIKLEQNYRSTQRILEAANNVILNNHQRLAKNLYASEDVGVGDKIRHYLAVDGEGEAAFVAEKVEEHVAYAGTRCAVLYRTNAQSRLFEEALRRRSVAYNMVGGFSFYGRAEIKDMIAYLKVALNPKDDIAMARVINSPPRGIGKSTLEVIFRKQRDLGLCFWESIGTVLEENCLAPRAHGAVAAFRRLATSLTEWAGRAEARNPVASLVRRVALESGYVEALTEERTKEAESRKLNIEELVNAATEADRKGESLRDFIDQAALASDTDQYNPEARVTLMTMHSAKGLEFPVVFVVGMEEGLFPHFRSADGVEELEEERRLCYVAITRAQKYLYVTHAARRRRSGEEQPAQVSRFLREIPWELIDDLSIGVLSLSKSASAARPFGGPRNTTNYQGKTYNSADDVVAFLENRASLSRPDPIDVGSHQLGVGSRVRHSRYGYGVVLNCEGAGDDAKVTVNFPGFGRKKFVARFASLERI